MLEPTPNSPIVNEGLLYVNGLSIAKAAAQKLTLNTGAARDGTNTDDMILSATATINGALVGANGVDVAVLANSSLYAVYVIGDSTDHKPTAGLLSLSLTPSLPFGYDMFRRVGWSLTDGSADILQFWQYGDNESRMYYYDVGISVLSGGSSTTYAEVDLSAAVPAMPTEVLFNVSYTANSATNKAQFLPFGSSATNGIVVFGYGVAAAQAGMATVPCQLDSDGEPEILYKVAASDSLTLLVAGYKDYL